jgi:signal transduction histidine kinase
LLDGKKLTIEYINNRLKEMINLNEDVINSSFAVLAFLKFFRTVIVECYSQKKEKQINEVEILENRFYSVTICGKANTIEIFIQETTAYVRENRKNTFENIEKLNKEKEKFLSISTELKTKCDIIEILRDREKEHLMHLRDVINNISEGLIVIDNKGKFSLSNRAAYIITELNMGELIRMPNILKKYYIYNVESPEEDIDYVYSEVYKKLIPIKNLIVKLVDKTLFNTKFIELSSNPIISSQGDHLYTIVTIKDVTESKKHQIFAEEQAAFIKDVVNNLDVPIAVIDYPELTYKLINKKHQTILNRIVDDGAVIDNIASGGLLENFISNVGERGKDFIISPYSVRDENGCERFYKMKLIPQKDSLGEVKRIHVHGVDITEEFNHSKELEKITRLKDEFFTVISHELRTPITIIYSSLQLAYNIYGDEIHANIDKTLKRIDQNCSRLLKLVNNILDLSKAEAGFLSLNCSSFDIVNITEFIISSVNLYARSKNIELIFDTNEEECLVYFDRDKYEKILLNLLSNAIKFTPEGKQILVTMGIDEENVSLCVKDEGIGIPESKLDYIFDRFAQVNTSLSRRAEGTGIGLSLVKKLVEFMEGTILVRSQEGLGSEFLVVFKRQGLELRENQAIASIDTTISDKIDIEFSDIN